ncbi:MAG: PQQ-binding-like beta-propeller repeat protein [Verrucomicrobia bacterium]|nr:PQQ-binding-like beta-propeller repeat protein [Verrucomicrobiota bacterium]MBI3868339.1 PQQ-binding-like beta-propeller repeat protein [Verrucomicrobiota bacterium]
MNTFHSTLAVSLILLAAASARGDDWPQYRGGKFDGASKEPVLRVWPAGGLTPAWRAPLSDGFSSFSTGGGKAYTLVARTIDGVSRETVVALDADNGRELWAYPIALAKYDGGGNEGSQDNRGGDGPRSTPAYSDGSVYALSSGLQLVCLNAESGRLAWTRDILGQHAGKNISWQNAASPVIDGDSIFLAGGGPGQALLAIHKKTGEPVWQGQDDRMTHATPVVATLSGQRQVIFFTQSGLVSLDTRSGALLWRFKFPYNVSTAAAPVVFGNIVYCSAGYSVGSAAARVTKSGSTWEATEMWRLTGNKICNHWSTPVALNGHLYGMFGFKEYGRCAVKCVEIATGAEKWAQPGFGPGNVTLVDGHLLALSDSGDLVLIKPEPSAYKELARMKAVQGKCWSTPVVSNGRVLVRSTKEGASFVIAPKTAQSGLR